MLDGTAKADARKSRRAKVLQQQVTYYDVISANKSLPKVQLAHVKA